MYEARQNKEKVSRRIDAGCMARQRVKMEDGRKNNSHSSQIVQKMFHMTIRNRHATKPVVPCYSNGKDPKGYVYSLWTQGMRRPNFSQETNEALYRDSQSNSKGRKLYLCRISQTDTAYLPKQKDAARGEDFATIGHITQWKEYARDNALWSIYSPINDPDDWKFSSTLYQDVVDKFNDINNLQLEGSAYNNGKAYRYENDPLTQEWVDD